MSVVSMKKMSLIAHSSEESRLMKIFLKSGYVEISTTNLLDLTCYPDRKDHKEEVENKLLKLSFAINFLKDTLIKQKTIDKKAKKEEIRQDKEDLPKISFKRENKLVSLEEFEETAKDEIELFSCIYEIEKINSSLIDIKSEKARHNALIEQLTPYKDVDIKFSEIKDTLHTTNFLGYIPTTRAEIVSEKLSDKVDFSIFDGEKYRAIFIVCHNEDEVFVKSILNENEFTKCNFTFDTKAQEKIDEVKQEIEKLEIKKETLSSDAIHFLTFANRLKMLYDHYLIELGKIECMAKSPSTKRVFIMEGWVPAEKINNLEKEVKDKCKRTEIFFRDPLETENPPTLTSNSSLVSPFTGITDNFGRPNYREQDPNLFVAFFYFLIFGIMMSDAGYGLIIAIACFTIVKITKPVKNSGKMLLMFGFCGISTLIWGALFGSWFAITPSQTFLKYLTWFSPMEQPLLLFMLALGVGMLQIGTGFALKGVAQIKAKKIFRGIFNNFSWIIIFIGIFCISPNLMIFLGAINPSPVPDWFALAGQIGTFIAIGGFIMLVIGGAMGKKNPIKMLGGAFGNIYGSINVVSDLLSYSRLFGLGLTTGVIGYAINILASLIVDIFFKGFWLGWVVAAPILIVGHAFNLGINLLGAYVHDSRLQYIEFFSRFYEGSGHAFIPIGSKTKYTFLQN